MKIVYISSSTIPSRTANSIHVMKMCQAFSKLGHDVYLIAPERGKVEELDNKTDVFDFYGVDNCFRIVKIPWVAIRGTRHIYGIRAAFKAYQLQADVVYGRNLQGCYFASLGKKRVIYEEHQPINREDKTIDKQFMSMVNKKSFKKMVVISEALKQYFIATYKIDDEKIIVAHDGADPTIDDNQIDECTVNDTKPKNKRMAIGYVGQLYSGKGMEIILPLAKKCPWADLHVIGGTEEDISYWKGMSSNIKNIHFHGFVPQNQLHKYWRMMDVFMAPYLKQVKGAGNNSKEVTKRSNIAEWMSPLKIFEYMAQAKAIVASDLPVLREVLIHNENALLCDPDRLEEWVTALESLRNDDILRMKLGNNAKKSFLKNYTWLERAKKVLSF